MKQGVVLVLASQPLHHAIYSDWQEQDALSPFGGDGAVELKGWATSIHLALHRVPMQQNDHTSTHHTPLSLARNANALVSA